LHFVCTILLSNVVDEDQIDILTNMDDVIDQLAEVGPFNFAFTLIEHFHKNSLMQWLITGIIKFPSVYSIISGYKPVIGYRLKCRPSVIITPKNALLSSATNASLYNGNQLRKQDDFMMSLAIIEN